MPRSLDELEDWLSRPTPALEEMADSIEGDLVVLGAGGKMGASLARMARRCLSSSQRVFAISRFRDQQLVDQLESWGIEAQRCDLLNRDEVASLPDAPNVIFMAGQKFGTEGNPEETWMSNTVLPQFVAERYPQSRIVVFSTGCVYPWMPTTSGGADESTPLAPPGEYANSCVGRERVFAYHSKRFGTPITLFRLNYAIDLRYGVLHDVASKVFSGDAIDVSVGYVNVIWQGDANARAIQSLRYASSPPVIVNVTGRECISIRWLVGRFGELFGRVPKIVGEEGPTAWLADASKSFDWFGPVTVSLGEMIEATAEWVRDGGPSLRRPTHFDSTDGRF